MPLLHVAFFNRSFYPDNAATGQLLTELCEDLVQKYDCRVSVVAGVPLSPETQAPSRPLGLVEREDYRGITIMRARGTRFSKRRFAGRVSNYVSYFLSASYAGLQLDHPDLVVALTDPPIIGLAAYLASRRFRIPFLMSYRDIFPEVARLLEDFQSEAVNWLLTQVNRFLVRKADRSIALGETMRQRLIEGKGADPASTIIIPDWADCSEIVPAPRENALARQLELMGRFVVMHSGNIGLSQGLECLVDAAGYLRDLPDLQVVFVGGGVKKASLMKRVEDLGLENVRFLPYAPKEGLKDSFACADLFVISLKRGLAGYIVPSKLYGILAAGRPYVAAVEEASEVTAITRKYDCGLLAEPANAQHLAAKIRLLYQDRAMRERMGQNARVAGLEFDRAVQVRAYYELFVQLAGRASSQFPQQPDPSR